MAKDCDALVFRQPAAAVVRPGGRSNGGQRLPGKRLKQIFVRGRGLGVDLGSCRPFRLPLLAPARPPFMPLSPDGTLWRRSVIFRRSGEAKELSSRTRPGHSQAGPRAGAGTALSGGSQPEARSSPGARPSSAITATRPRTLPQIPAKLEAPASPPFGDRLPNGRRRFLPLRTLESAFAAPRRRTGPGEGRTRAAIFPWRLPWISGERRFRRETPRPRSQEVRSTRRAAPCRPPVSQDSIFLSSNLRTFPITLRGSASTNTTSRGCL